MEGFHNTLLLSFLEAINPIKKKNQGYLVGRVCATAALNQTISGEEWGCGTQVIGDKG